MGLGQINFMFNQVGEGGVMRDKRGSVILIHDAYLGLHACMYFP